MKKNYKHLWLFAYFPIYLIWFHYIETTITRYFHVIKTPWDDMIPFCEFFIVPYLLWFGYVAWGVLYFAYKNKQDFYRLCAFLYTGMTIFLIISSVYPNGHYLRPHTFARDNIFTDLCQFIYAHDTATNLFPSIHVYNSLGIQFAVVHSEAFSNNKKAKALSGLLATSIILSTLFVKQHSCFDVITAFLLAFIMHFLVYQTSFSKFTPLKFLRKHQKKLAQASFFLYLRIFIHARISAYTVSLSVSFKIS